MNASSELIEGLSIELGKAGYKTTGTFGHCSDGRFMLFCEPVLSDPVTHKFLSIPIVEKVLAFRFHQALDKREVFVHCQPLAIPPQEVGIPPATLSSVSPVSSVVNPRSRLGPRPFHKKERAHP
jgi:hypothetical protein